MEHDVDRSIPPKFQIRSDLTCSDRLSRTKRIDVVGALESKEFSRQSRPIAESWQQRMALTRYEEIAGTNHFTVIDPLDNPDSAMTARVAAMAHSVNSMAL